MVSKVWRWAEHRTWLGWGNGHSMMLVLQYLARDKRSYSMLCFVALSIHQWEDQVLVPSEEEASKDRLDYNIQETAQEGEKTLNGWFASPSSPQCFEPQSLIPWGNTQEGSIFGVKPWSLSDCECVRPGSLLGEHNSAAYDCSHCLQDQEQQVARKKRRASTKVQTRSIGGASLEVSICYCQRSIVEDKIANAARAMHRAL